jgi:hypothetical protein
MAPPIRKNPPAQMRERLSELRGRRFSFALAWETAWGELDFPHAREARNAWKEALRETKHEWRAAYERRPTTTSEAVARLVVALTEADPPRVRGERSVAVAMF